MNNVRVDICLNEELNFRLGYDSDDDDPIMMFEVLQDDEVSTTQADSVATTQIDTESCISIVSDLDTQMEGTLDIMIEMGYRSGNDIEDTLSKEDTKQ